MRKRKILAVVLCLVLCILPVFSSMAQAKASDIKGHWAEGILSRWLDQGLAKGYPDGTFKPQKDVTRGEFMAFVNRFFGFTKTVEISYPDVAAKSHYYKDVQIAAAEGYMAVDNGKIRPEDPMTRQEVAEVIARMLHLDVTVDADELAKYKDAGDISNWAKGPVSAVSRKMYMYGYPDKTFKPLRNITRAETVITLDRIKKAYDEIHRPSIQALKATNGTMEVTLSQAVSGLAIEDFAVTATLDGKVYSLQNLVFKADNVSFTFTPVAQTYSSQSLVITAAAASTSTKIQGTANATVTIPAYAAVSTGGGSNPTPPPANSAPSTPVITRTPAGTVTVDDDITITAASTDPDGDTITYVWEGREAVTAKYTRGKHVVKCKAVDEHGAESAQAAIVFIVIDSGSGSGGMILTGPESRIYENGLDGATITNYTFNVPYVWGHWARTDYGMVKGLNCQTRQWEILQYGTTFNGISFTKELDAGKYTKLEFFYYTPHDCMYNKSNITYTVDFVFSEGEMTPESAPVAGNVSIVTIGTGRVCGDYTYTDANGDLEGYEDSGKNLVYDSLYQWYRADDATGTNKTAIAGATKWDYSVTAADEGKYLTFKVTPSAITGVEGTTAGSAVESAPIQVGPKAPEVLYAYITGVAKEGQVLTGGYVYGDLNGDPEGASTYQWYRASDVNGTDKAAIAGATGKTYTVTADDNGKALFFEVTPVASAGTDTTGAAVMSYSMFIAEMAPFAFGIYIDGSSYDESGLRKVVEVGYPVAGGYSYYDSNGDPEGTSVYKWYRAIDASGTGKTLIAGATNKTYMLTPDDESKYLTFEVTPVAQAGDSPGVMQDSAPMLMPEEAPRIEDEEAYITGNMEVGQTLTLVYEFWDSDGDDEVNSVIQWYRGQNYDTELVKELQATDMKDEAGRLKILQALDVEFQPILGATGKQYTLTAADYGYSIFATVTPVAETGRDGETIGGSTYEAYAYGVVTSDNAPPEADEVSINGTLEVGQTLTGTYEYWDDDEDAEGVSTFKWYRANDDVGTNKTAIPGATAITYTVTAADAGKYLSFEVTPVAAAGLTPGESEESMLYFVPDSVASVKAIDDIDAANGTLLAALGLPGEVEVTLLGGSTRMLAVTWDGGDPAYDGSTAGTYTFAGTLTLPGGVTNPGNLKASVKVIVAEPVVPAGTYTISQQNSLSDQIVVTISNLEGAAYFNVYDTVNETTVNPSNTPIALDDPLASFIGVFNTIANLEVWVYSDAAGANLIGKFTLSGTAQTGILVWKVEVPV